MDNDRGNVAHKPLVTPKKSGTGINSDKLATERFRLCIACMRGVAVLVFSLAIILFWSCNATVNDLEM
jgi:hypothetical protein